MGVVIKCPKCRTRFRWLAVSDDYPDTCPNCAADIGHHRADDDVVMPNILSFSTRCSDGVYKAMERASEERMHQAAELAGVPSSEMASLKITNMRDNMREGDIAAMPVVNDVTRQMEAVNARGGQFGFGGGTGLSFSAAVPTGSQPNAGAHMQRVVNDVHPNEAVKARLPAVDLRSTRPAIEIFNPGYRQRV